MRCCSGSTGTELQVLRVGHADSTYTSVTDVFSSTSMYASTPPVPSMYGAAPLPQAAVSCEYAAS
jgi:hypothetical protein